MFKGKPIISNQHGALVMAFVPYLYGIFASEWVFPHLWLGLSWLCLYLFSYPFLSIFSKKSQSKYKQWAIIYAIIALLFAYPLLRVKFSLLQFLLPILPLVLVQMYYAKKRDERNIVNDITGICIFGIVGMASFYLATEQYNIAIWLHPSLFFIATTLYVKSVARERKNPRYLKLSLGTHAILGLIYGILSSPIAIAYLFGLLRAIIVPKRKLSIKQIGLLEFPIVLILLVCLMFSSSLSVIL